MKQTKLENNNTKDARLDLTKVGSTTVQKTIWNDKSMFDDFKAVLEQNGFQVLTKWRKGIKNIKLGDIILGEKADDRE